MDRLEHFKFSTLFSTEKGLGKILFIGMELLLMVLIIRIFNIQDATFQNLSVLILIGFLINALLAQRYRLLFFTLLSMASLPLILGLLNGAWVLGLGLALIGASYLPLSFSARLGIIALLVTALIGLRLQWVQAPWEAVVWQILGAMFMFRMIIYLYDIKHVKHRPDWKHTLSYFFMLPNVCFPLFPVVDYKKFQRSHYAAGEPGQVYQRGIVWMFRGVLHLLLYRMAYQYLTIDPVEVQGLGGVLHFSFSAFALYLQVSGLFHLIVGVLLLFGFNLPQTNHLYFFASNFNDFWRRINIYWKDFMMKIFYYPVYFKVRKLGETRAIIISTVVVFFATWFLHAYQWFWLRGVFLLEWHDALYWAVLAVFVILNSLYESRYGRERSLGTQRRGIFDYFSVVLSTAATFLTLGLLWGMWSSDLLSQWVAMWISTGAGGAALVVLIPALFAASWGAGQLGRHRRTAHKTRSSTPVRKPSPAGFWRPALGTALSMALVYVLGQNVMYSKLPDRAADLVDSMRFAGLSKRDQRKLERGYYENLVGTQQRHRLWQIEQQKRPGNWNKNPPGTLIPTDHLRGPELTPNIEYMYKGALVKTNRWGMRDEQLELIKPENTLRIALLGASHVFGSGVDNEHIFPSLVEAQLNAQHQDERKIEILNFALTARTAVHQVGILEEKVLKFAPDVVFYIGHKDDPRRVVARLAKQIKDGITIPYPDLATVIQQAKINDSLDISNITQRLYPYGEQILAWAYARIVASCREQGILPVYIFLPMVYERLSLADINDDISTAQNAGFLVINLMKTYRLHDPDELYITPWDKHPNTLGHRLITEHFIAQLNNSWDEVTGEMHSLSTNN